MGPLCGTVSNPVRRPFSPEGNLCPWELGAACLCWKQAQLSPSDPGRTGPVWRWPGVPLRGAAHPALRWLLGFSPQFLFKCQLTYSETVVCHEPSRETCPQPRALEMHGVGPGLLPGALITSAYKLIDLLSVLCVPDLMLRLQTSAMRSRQEVGGGTWGQSSC